MNFDPRLIDMVMQLRSRGVSNADVLRAVEQTPRKRFLPESLHERAYEPRALPLDCGQSVSAPFESAIMMQMLEPNYESKVLDIGTGSGWMAATLSRIVRRVYSVERYRRLIADAETALRKSGITNVEIRHGDGRYGWPGQAPFSRIIIGCGVRAIPEKILDQLAPNGRLVAVVDGTLTVVERARKHFSETDVMPMTLPMIEAGKSKSL